MFLRLSGIVSSGARGGTRVEMMEGGGFGGFW